MEHVDGSENYETQHSTEQSPSLLTIILDTNPAAWALIADILPLSKAVADLLVFINAHLAYNYANKVAVLASHGDRAQWLYPDPESHTRAQNGTASSHIPDAESNKYRPFRLVEEELTRNLQTLVTSTTPASISAHSSTMIAGALTLALTYINRETIAYNESITGVNPNLADQSTTQAATTDASGAGNALTNPLQARILLLTLSPSADLAHQYIPIMNSIFACQRLNIPIDVLQLPLPVGSAAQSSSNAGSNGAAVDTATIGDPSDASNSTVFLQQAADATKGIFIPVSLSAVPSATRAAKISPSTKISLATSALLTYLLTAFLPSPTTRTNMILPTRIDVDFRAACFCHRNVISTGFVCSICLSIFCAVPEGGECLTCGTTLTVGDYGGRPVVVPRRKKKKQQQASGSGSRVGTPVPA